MRPEHWLFTIPLRLRSLFRRAQADQALDDELRDHLERKTEEYVAQGMAREEAHRLARLDLGGIEQTKVKCRDTRRVNRTQDLIQDLHFALRILRKNPGFTSIAVLTLALAMGANTAIFSAVYAVLIKRLPFKNADRLVFIFKKNVPRGWSRNPISPAEILAWRSQTEAFEDFGAYTESSCVLTGAGEAEEDPCEVITRNFFPLLGVAPYRGRTFTPEEDKTQAPRAAILSYGLWHRRFGGDENVIGRSITLNGVSHTVVGVMPANLSHLYASPYGSVPGMWVSGMGLAAEHTWNDYFGIARLKPGAAEARRDASTGPHANGHGFHAPRKGLSRPRWMACAGDELPNQQFGGYASGAARVDGGHNICSSDCVRKHRQPVAGSQRWQSQRVCGS